MSGGPRLLAVSDLHAGHEANREVIRELRPVADDDWLVVAGDVGETFADIEWTLRQLSERFATVIWTPGDHELRTPPSDPVRLRGEHRYRRLVELCRGLGIATPEDPYPVWRGAGGPVTVAPLFVLCDHTSSPPGPAATEATGYDAEEDLLYPDPHPSREAWCDVRVIETEQLLAARDAALPTILVSHVPLAATPRRPESALCGPERTAGWHRRFRAVAVVHGHPRVPRTTWYDGVRFEDVSLEHPHGRPRQIMPIEERR